MCIALVANIKTLRHIEIHIHAYIHNCSLQSFSQDYDLAAHSTYVVCVNFYPCVAGPTILNRLQTIDFWQYFLFSELLPEICGEEVAEEIFFFFIFRFDA